jgi:membrane associated rhomboid family serine protease
MIETPVGDQCPTCVDDGNRRVRQTRWTPTTSLGRGNLTPVVTVLVAVNVVAFLISNSRTSVINRYAELPVAIANGQYERLLTAAFLHANLLHILFNMLALVIIGPPVERVIGPVRFAILYLLAALGGSVCGYLFGSPTVYAVGASGAIFGLFGAYFVFARSRRADTSGIVALIIINLVFSFAEPLVDWRAHVGGLVTGTVVAAAFAFAERRPPVERRAIEVAVVVAVTILLVGLVHLRTDQLRAVT